MNMLKQLVAHLRENKGSIVEQRELLHERWDPTYGPQAPSSETVEIVDFDRLMREIDAFAETFK